MLILGIRTNQVFEVYHNGEQMKIVFFMGKDGNPKMGVKAPQSFDIHRLSLTDELKKDLNLEESKPRKVNKLSRHNTSKIRKNTRVND